MRALSIYCVHLNGSLLSTPQCTHLLLRQGSQFMLMILSMAQVLRLAGGPMKSLHYYNQVQTVLFALHLLALVVVVLLSLAILLIASVSHFSASSMISASLAAAMWFFYAAQLVLEFVQHEESSKLVTFFVLVYALQELLETSPEFQSEPLLLRSKVTSTIIVATFASIRAFVDRHDGEKSEKSAPLPENGPVMKKSPLDRVGWLSQLSVCWISPLITLGTARRLEMNDIPDLPAQDSTLVAAKAFKIELQHEMARLDRSFFRVLWRLYRTDVLRFGLWSTLNKLLGFTSPLLLKLFLDWADSSSPSLSKGASLAAAMIGRSLLAALSGTQYNLAWKRFELRVRAGLEAAIYRKTLSSQERHRARGLGRITNLLSVDVGRIIGMPSSVFDIVLIPLEILVALVLLSQAVSAAFIAGVAVLSIMLPLQTILGRKIQCVTSDMLHCRDNRLSLVAENLAAIRTLKLLGWIQPRLDMMNQRRALEMHHLQVRKYLDAFCVFFWASTPVIVQVSVFMTAIFTGRDISAADAFTAIALLDRLIFPMNYLPWILNGFLEAKVSAVRIQDFLFGSNDEMRTKGEVRDIGTFEKHTENDLVHLQDCAFVWNSSTGSSNDETVDDSHENRPLLMETVPSSGPLHYFKLQIQKLEIQRGSMYVIYGPVGAGKSSLLLALLGEMSTHKLNDASPSFAKRRGLRCSYCPQTRWLFRGSVHSNVTLSSADTTVMNDAELARYERVVTACEVQGDRQVPDHVAERGSNLSGGQRARLQLARALYQDAELYLLDDPFSGLDVKTANTIVTNCFQTRSSLVPAHAAVVIVTHSVHVLPSFPSHTQLLVMDEGKIVEQGTLETLTAPGRSSRLRSFLSEASAAPCTQMDEKSTETMDYVEKNGVTRWKQAREEDDEEEREAGGVRWYIWTRYFSRLGWLLTLVLLLSLVAMQSTRNAVDWWIALDTNGTHSISSHEFIRILLYLTGAHLAAAFCRAFLFAYGGLRAAKKTYRQLMHGIFAAPLCFFEKTPTGRILNRFSGDTYAIDESLPFVLNICLKEGADVFGTLVILVYTNPFVLLVLFPLSIVYVYLQKTYRPTSRHLKRLEAVTQSSLLALFTDTFNGLRVLRAAGKQKQYRQDFIRRLNCHQRVSFLSSTTSAWFGLRLDLLGVCVISFVVLFAVADFHFTGRVNPGMLGLILTYALPLVGKLNSILNCFVDTERQMIAVERIQEYTGLESEEAMMGAQGETQVDKIPSSWPSEGHISIRALTVTYSKPVKNIEKDWEWVGPVAAPALKYITCEIPAGQKVGICGRTGAGKSTLLNALFRAVPWERKESILIDNVALDSVRLGDLRARLCYIPQDVVLFSGTIRSNLDAKGTLDDAKLWNVLRKCGLATTIAKFESGLETVLEGGTEDQVARFSHGQAQLLCIARALLRPSKVVCIDEATASIDHETARAISTAIASEFSTSTVLMVAHRIKTIMECHHILLLENGRIAERGDPNELAQNSQSLFYRFVHSRMDSSDPN